MFSRKSKNSVAENLSGSAVQALSGDHLEEGQGVGGIGKDNCCKEAWEMQQLEEVRRERGAKGGSAYRATESRGIQGKCKQASKDPTWSGNRTCLGLHACLSSHLSSTAKPNYELWVPFGTSHTAQREPLSRLTLPCVAAYMMHVFWRSIFMHF